MIIYLGLLGSICAPLSFARSTTILRTRDSQALPKPYGLSTLCNVFTAAYYAVNYVTFGVGGPAISTYRRYHLRQKYGIDGNILRDVATHFCCHCCALVQEDKEITLRETERKKIFAQEQDSLADELAI